MKKILPFLLIALVSTVTNAENSFVMPKPGDLGQRAISKVDQTETSAISEVVLAKNEANNLGLWKRLDINKDDSISKSEAASSEVVFRRWSELDTNKDNGLDYIEFSRLSYQGQ